MLDRRLAALPTDGDLPRLVTHHDQYGDRAEARWLHDERSPAERGRTTAGLEAARQACPNRLDFESLLPGIDRDPA